MGMIADCVIDVGAHWGEVTLPYALHHPNIPIFAFEPDPRAFPRLMFSLPNYHPFLMCVSEKNGFQKFFLYRVPGTSSLLRLNYSRLRHWPGGEHFAEMGVIWVPSIRLDTFMEQMGIQSVRWLKVDTQGYDIGVLRSLGDRIDDVQRITVETPIKDVTVYDGGLASKDEIDRWLVMRGFQATDMTVQTYGYEANITYER